MNTAYSKELYDRACDVIPGGVSSPVRAFKNVKGHPLFIESAKGAYITDVDGNGYVDYVQSFGASILGHANEEVEKSVAKAVRAGTSFAAPTKGEIELAVKITERVPGCEMVRFVSSGTEAVMTAVRLARAFTKRSRIIKFDGCYHGHSDALLAGGGSGLATLGLPDSEGVTEGAVADTIVVEYNKVPELDESIACVIVEPVAANMGLVPPLPGFLPKLRQACDQVGALLIFDEVITGFRLGYGGASNLFNIEPDLWCFGKVVGGGFPLAAIGGHKVIMSSLAPLGGVYQAGTLSGNPVATAAGNQVLDLLDESSYEQLEEKASYLVDGMQKIFEASGIKAVVNHFGTLFSVFLATDSVANYADAKISGDSHLYPIFFHEMLNNGIYLAPSPYETWFVSLSHGMAELDATLAAAKKAALAVAAR